MFIHSHKILHAINIYTYRCVGILCAKGLQISKPKCDKSFMLVGT